MIISKYSNLYYIDDGGWHFTCIRTPEDLEEIRTLEAEEETRFTPLTGPARRGGRVTGLTQQ